MIAKDLKPLYRKYSAVERGKAERDKVRRLNRPTLRENQRIRARNKELKGRLSDYHYVQQKDRLKKLPHRLDDDVKRLLESEKDNRAALYDREPWQWVICLNKIDDEVLRTRVACIVWWDYFGREERNGEYSDLLDSYLTRPFVEIPLNDLIRGLVTVGYTAHHAILRTTKAEDN